MPLDYPPELICTAYCNNPECAAQIAVECQYGDRQPDVEKKLTRKGWIVDGEAVFCGERCRIRHAARFGAAAVALSAPSDDWPW